VLRDVGLLETRLGNVVVSAAVVDDVLSLVLLAVLTAVVRTGSLPDLAAIGWLLGKVALFFALTIPVGRWLLPAIGSRVVPARAAEVEFSFLMIVALAFAVLAEQLGMHFIIGAFLAGLFFGRRTLTADDYEDVKRKTATITDGFLAPIFFASIGLHLDPASLGRVPGFVLLLVVVATLGKVVGAGGAARASGLGYRESLGVGTAMNARGAVELIVADVALRAGLFSRPDPPPPVVQSLYSAVVVMAVLTTVLTPIVMARLVREGGLDAQEESP
jgi:Kef-type K+ transport system membrane component KefB